MTRTTRSNRERGTPCGIPVGCRQTEAGEPEWDRQGSKPLGSGGCQKQSSSRPASRENQNGRGSKTVPDVCDIADLYHSSRAQLNPQFEPLLNTTEAAGLLQIHPKTLQKLARAEAVMGVRIGKLWRFRASALNEWLARMTG